VKLLFGGDSIERPYIPHHFYESQILLIPFKDFWRGFIAPNTGLEYPPETYLEGIISFERHHRYFNFFYGNIIFNEDELESLLGFSVV
jgi:hypothetical protein